MLIGSVGLLAMPIIGVCLIADDEYRGIDPRIRCNPVWSGIAPGRRGRRTRSADETSSCSPLARAPSLGLFAQRFRAFSATKGPFPRHRLVLLSPKRSVDLIKAEDCLIPGIWTG